MANPFTPAQHAEANQTESPNPFLWLFEVEVPTDPITRARVAGFDTDVVFGTDSAGDDVTYKAGELTLSQIRESGDGTIPKLGVGLSNISQEWQALLEAHAGLVGQPARLLLVNFGTLEAGAYLQYDSEIISVESDARRVNFEMGNFNLSNQKVPDTRAMRDFCRFRYKGPRCGYTGAISDCDKTLNGANGCVVHANSPRFGGFPAIPKVGGI